MLGISGLKKVSNYRAWNLKIEYRIVYFQFFSNKVKRVPHLHIRTLDSIFHVSKIRLRGGKDKNHQSKAAQ